MDSAGHRFSLVLVWQPGWQAREDLEEIAGLVTARAPDVRVFVVSNQSPALVARKKSRHRPTLVVSLAPLRRFRPERGRIYQGIVVSKADQKARLVAAGLPVPNGKLLEPGLYLDPAEWGDLVIVKPVGRDNAFSGRGVSLMRTSDVRYYPPGNYPEHHPGRIAPMMVEQFIDTGDHPAYYRVLTLFGEPLSAIHHSTVLPRPPLSAPAEDLRSAPFNVSEGYVRMKFVADPDLLELGRQAYAALPEVPVHACDMVRDAATGRLYILELNPGQNAWRISSDYWCQKRQVLGGRQAMIDQLCAWERAADVLVARTRTEAE